MDKFQVYLLLYDPRFTLLYQAVLDIPSKEPFDEDILNTLIAKVENL